MKKIKKLSFLSLFLLNCIGIISCSNSFNDDAESEKGLIKEEVVPQKVVIGDELIYGESFSFENVYKAIANEIETTSSAINDARTADAEEPLIELNEDDFVEMVYFSVHPSTTDSLKLVNEKMGYLNPVELDKDIIQACDPDKLIFTSTDIEDLENIEEYVNFDAKYYYIVTKQIANELSFVLEGFDVIEDFEMITEEAIERISVLCQDYSEEDYDVSRGIFSKLWEGIKKVAETVANAVCTVAKTVVDFIVKSYTISGTVKYTYAGKTLTAYGVNVKNITLGGNNDETDINGKFNLGSRTDSAGLCFLWLDYENKACKLTNFLGVTASTLVKTALPSYLQDVTITTSSDYANAKMAVCSDMYYRYNDELKRHSNIPQAYVWTTEFGDKTSSSPAFNIRGASILPDIILTGLTSESNTNLKVMHHEYTHFLQCVYTENKNNFWDNVVLSEIGCTLANATVELINKIFNSNLSTSYLGPYNFENPYVNFTENYAEWYSYVGFYSKGMFGKNEYSIYADGSGNRYSSVYQNVGLFSSLIDLLKLKNYTNPADSIVNIVDKYNVITFNELYTSLVKEYPLLKNEINNVFRNKYILYGSKDGNIIIYQ